jgi:hypothetical protein
MTSYEFVIWLKGFSEACNDFTTTPKQWDRIKEVLNEVEDYEESVGLDFEIDDFESETPPYNPFSGTIQTSGSTGFLNTGGGNTTTTVWNDKMGCWHYTNYPEGFGYYTNSTLGKTTPEETKKQLLD